MPPKGCVHKVKKPRPSARREIDLYEVVEIAPYDSGAIPGGIRAWNDAHEEMMEGFYSDSRPVKMTVSELNEYLREVRSFPLFLSWQFSDLKSPTALHSLHSPLSLTESVAEER